MAASHLSLGYSYELSVTDALLPPEMTEKVAEVHLTRPNYTLLNDFLGHIMCLKRSVGYPVGRQ